MCVQIARKDRGGRPLNDLMNAAISKNSEGTSKSGVSWSCIACDHTQKGAPGVNRVFKHAASCKHLRELNLVLFDEICDTHSNGSLGSKLANKNTPMTGVKVSECMSPLSSILDAAFFTAIFFDQNC